MRSLWPSATEKHETLRSLSDLTDRREKAGIRGRSALVRQAASAGLATYADAPAGLRCAHVLVR